MLFGKVNELLGENIIRSLYTNYSIYICNIWRYFKNKKTFYKKDLIILGNLLEKYPILYTNIRDYFILEIKLGHDVKNEDLKIFSEKSKIFYMRNVIINKNITDEGLKYIPFLYSLKTEHGQKKFN